MATTALPAYDPNDSASVLAHAQAAYDAGHRRGRTGSDYEIGLQNWGRLVTAKAYRRGYSDGRARQPRLVLGQRS